MPDRPVAFDFIAKDRNYTGPVRRMERHTVRFGATIGKIGGVGLRAFGGLGVAVGGLAVAGATLGIKTAANLEQAQIAFKHLTSSAEKGRKTLAQLTKFAAETPFELPGVEQAAQLLLGAGQSGKTLIPVLRAVGDAASTAADPADAFNRTVLALSQAMNKGKLQGEELMQITEAGIPIWRLLSEATGKPVAKLQDLATKGKLLTKDVLPKLFDQMHKDYGGAMEEQSRTLSGVWSTFKDTVSQSLAKALTPLADLLKNVLPGAGEAFQTAIKDVTDFITTKVMPALGGKGGKGGLSGLLQTVKDDAKAFADSFGGTAGGVKARLDDAKASLDSLKQALDLVNVAFGDTQKTGLPSFFKFLGAVVGRAAEEFTGLGKLGANAILMITKGAAALTLVGDYVKLGVLVGQGWLANLEIGALKTFRAVAKFMDLVFHTHMADALNGAISSAEGWRSAITGKVEKAKTNIDRKWSDLRKALGQRINTDVTASLKLEFTKSFTQKDWVQVRLAAGRMAAGGLVAGPGGPTADMVPALLSSGEFVVNAAAVRQIGVQNMKRLNAMRFAAGGLIGEIPSEARAISKLEAWGTGRRMDRGINKIMSMFGGAGGGSLAQWILAAIGITGVPMSWAAPLRRRAMFESGGNPRAINLWDINAQRGTPSIGLMQTIGPTFNRFAWDGLRNIWNPIHNLVAAIRYILARYGSIFAIDPPVRGYDRGGWLPPGLSMAYNGTARSEPVGFDYDRLAAALVGAFDGARVVMDGRQVGQLVTPHVRTGIRAQQRRDGVPAAQQVR